VSKTISPGPTRTAAYFNLLPFVTTTISWTREQWLQTLRGGARRGEPEIQLGRPVVAR
jgi:hypothetical protein